MDKSDRRNSPRQRKEANIQVLLIPEFSNDPRESCDLISAKMVNQSEEGLCIEIDRYLHPGSNVRIKIASQENGCLEKACYIRDGLVIRCEKVDDATSRFGLGVKILRKAIQAQILTSRFK